MPNGRLGLFYWTGAMWFVLALLGGFAAPSIELVARISGVSLRLASSTGTLIDVTVIALCGAMMYATRYAFLKRLRVHWFALCPTCMYPLKRETGLCTECGREITRRHARMYWLGILAHPFNMFMSEKKVVADSRWWRELRRANRGLPWWRIILRRPELEEQQRQ